MRCRTINILFVITVLFSTVHADIKNFQKDISILKTKIEQKNNIKSELENLNNQIKNIEGNKTNWIQHRKLAKLSEQKSEKSDDILQLYEEISALKSKCRDQFNELVEYNRSDINSIIMHIENNDRGRTSLIQLLLDANQTRDYLLDSQKYFANMDENLLEPNNDFDYLNFADNNFKSDFIAIIKIKIQNVANARNAALKEVKMRNKLNEFRDEIAYFHEPQFEVSTDQEKATAATESESRNDYDNWGADNSEVNFDNSISSSTNSFNYNFETIKSEDDFLLLFEGQKDESVEMFIKRMDSLKVYYEDILDNLSK